MAAPPYGALAMGYNEAAPPMGRKHAYGADVQSGDVHQDVPDNAQTRRIGHKNISPLSYVTEDRT